jgi:probable selenate reductase FAD-binding subunit
MEYFKPKTLKDAEQLKKKNKSSAYFAGGTILNWKSSPKFAVIIDLNNLKLNKINVTQKKISIGALVTIQEILENNKLPDAIKSAAKQFNSINIRNVATIGGNIFDKYFVSNLLPVFLAFKSKVKYYFNGKQNTCLLQEWLKTKNGIVSEIIIDKPDRTVVERQERISEMDISTIVSAIGYKLTRNKISDLIVAVSGGEASTSILNNTSAYLMQTDVKEIDEKKLSQNISKDIKFTENIKVSKRVKLRLVESQIIDMLKSV